jgi:transposase-like protein
VWETLEAFARDGVQRLLEEEVDQLLGRPRYERRDTVDAAPGYRNGFGKPRRVSLSCGTLRVRRPQVRSLEARFARRGVLPPLFKRRMHELVSAPMMVEVRRAPNS